MLLISDKGWMFGVMGVGLISLGAWTVVWNALEGRGNFIPSIRSYTRALLHCCVYISIFA